MIKKFLTAGSVALLPMLALAQAGGNANFDIGYFEELVEGLGSLVNTAIPILIGIAVLYFIYGLVKYVASAEDDDKKAARQIMVYGVIIIAVMVSIWGLVGLLQDVFLGGSNFTTPEAPEIPSN